MDRLEAKRGKLLEVLEQFARGEQHGGLSAVHVMTPKPTCISPDLSALELVKMFHAKRFRHMLVTGPDDRLLGVISDRDVLRCFDPDGSPDKGALEAIHASELMSTDLITIGSETSLVKAVRLMVDYGINCLPVVAGSTVLGILTTTDLYLLLELLLQAIPSSPTESAVEVSASAP